MTVLRVERLQRLDQLIGELGALDLLGAVHESGEGADGLLRTFAHAGTHTVTPLVTSKAASPPSVLFRK